MQVYERSGWIYSPTAHTALFLSMIMEGHKWKGSVSLKIWKLHAGSLRIIVKPAYGSRVTNITNKELRYT